MFKLLNRLLISSVAILSWSYVSAEELFLEEVIVTATKREGVAQDIPLALSVLPENFIESNAIRSIAYSGFQYRVKPTCSELCWV